MIRNKKNLLIAAGLLMSTASYAQEGSASFLDKNFEDIVLYLLIVILVIFIVGILSIFKGMLNLMIDELPPEKQAKYEDNFLRTGFTWKSVTGRVSAEEEKDLLMLDHEYDGIQELDNHLPPWWKWLFYITIIYAVVYLGIYFSSDRLDQHRIYEVKVAEAEEAKAAFLAGLANNVDETNVELTTEESNLLAGAELYAANCVACHGKLGEGSQIAPNLTDKYWIHGGDIKDVFTTIKYGVPNKGMIAWEEQLLPGQMSDLSSYVLSLQGTNPPNAKEPQGELYEAGDDAEVEEGADDAAETEAEVTASVD